MSGFNLIDKRELDLLASTVSKLAEGYEHLPELPPAPSTDAMQTVLLNVAERMHDNYPYAHPLYAGQMLKPPHPIARTAYQMAMWVNPNNHALDGGRASSALEKEAVKEIAAMFGFAQSLGHLTSSGTLANLEALWIAGEITPDKVITASSESHYTHQRISAVLKLPFEAIPADATGRIDIHALRDRAKSGHLGTVVATAGTTSFGIVDPIKDIIDLGREFGFRVHVDAAYGGYFALSELPERLRRDYDAIAEADSVAIDPHKHGLQPYGCGCVLFSDPSVGKHYRHDSPYTYFSSEELHLGEISLECSRAGAAATALWATQSLLPLKKKGTFAQDLDRCRRAAAMLSSRLSADTRFKVIREQDLDIVVWAFDDPSPSVASKLAADTFDIAAEHELHLALIDVDATLVSDTPSYEGAGSVTCLRSCLMKPQHIDWVDEIYTRLDVAASAALAKRDT
ncbi:MAG: aminotransferase class V-fold PLP-dependent enzyme [Pseudomonadota bacterium]